MPDPYRTVIGIELGSTGSKAVLLDEHHEIIASGSHTWENSLTDNIWTNSMEDTEKGLQACFRLIRKHWITTRRR